MCEPAPIKPPITQKTPATPIAAPAAPNIKGMHTLDPLISIKRKPTASPWRSSGVIWCNMLIAMGCTLPSAKPSTAEHIVMVNALGIKG